MKFILKWFGAVKESNFASNIGGIATNVLSSWKIYLLLIALFSGYILKLKVGSWNTQRKLTNSVEKVVEREATISEQKETIEKITEDIPFLIGEGALKILKASGLLFSNKNHFRSFEMQFPEYFIYPVIVCKNLCFFSSALSSLFSGGSHHPHLRHLSFFAYGQRPFAATLLSVS